MLRVDMNTIVAFLKDHVRPAQMAGTNQMPRGYLLMDAAGFHSLGQNYPDLTRVGYIMGIDIIRLDALGDDHMDYYDSELNLIHTT